MSVRWPAMVLAGTFLFSGGSVSAQTCVGNCGALGPDGVVTAPPGGGGYQYVTTYGGTFSGGLPGIGGTNGSVYLSSLFSAAVGDPLTFYFNYITSDGAGFADYAWARLLNSDLSEAALLFTARTTPGGSSVPGFGMPDPSATLDPSEVVIVPGAPVWSPLGGYSGTCFATGCGYTGWVASMFEVALAGNYYLQFGVTNWSDTWYDSGLAWAGATIGDVPIDPTDPSVVPEPITLLLMGTGLAGIGAVRRRRRRLPEQNDLM
jgi:hypothetical protein